MLGPHIKIRGNIWGKVPPSSPNERKNLGSSFATRRKSWEKIPIFGVIFDIQRAKFGVFVTYIFRCKIWGSDKNFRGKYWGQAHPNHLIWKYPLGQTSFTAFCSRGTHYGTSSAATLLVENINSSSLLELKLSKSGSTYKNLSEWKYVSERQK